MRVLVASHVDVARWLPMPACIEAMASAFTSLAAGDVVLPLRQVVHLPGTPNALFLMPAADRAIGAIGTKALTVFPGNDAGGIPSHQGVVLLFDAHDGRLTAILDAGTVTAIRTAAVSGLATRLLANADAGDVAILGAGVQARTHLAAMCMVRQVRRVRVWSHRRARADAFAREAAASQGMAIEACGSARTAVAGADIICTVTAAATPVLVGADIAAGAHINAVGASSPTTRELDSAAVAMSRLFVDRRESALAESGDVVIARAEGAITDAHIRGELAELVTGAVRGRARHQDVTLFKSLGLAIEDLAAAHLVYERAVASGAGTWIEL